jgi:hypothetical protein
MDLPWSASVGGMMWPRGFVGAAAFWNFNSSANSQDPEFADAVWALNDAVIAAGGLSCPTRCACDQLTACGVPYVPPPPPPAGVLAVQPCVAGGSAAQQWAIAPGTGLLSSAANASLCVSDQGSETYPLALVPCAEGTAFAWRGPPGPAWLISSASGDCVDLRTSDGAVGTWECGSGSGLNQTNQNWWIGTTAPATIVSAANGGCITAVMS